MIIVSSDSIYSIKGNNEGALIKRQQFGTVTPEGLPSIDGI